MFKDVDTYWRDQLVRSDTLLFSLRVDKPDSPPPPATLEADQSSSEPAGGEEDEDTAPAEPDTAPTAETEPTSSGAVHITDFETVAYCKKSPALA